MAWYVGFSFFHYFQVKLNATISVILSLSMHFSPWHPWIHALSFIMMLFSFQWSCSIPLLHLDSSQTQCHFLCCIFDNSLFPELPEWSLLSAVSFLGLDMFKSFTLELSFKKSLYFFLFWFMKIPPFQQIQSFCWLVVVKNRPARITFGNEKWDRSFDDVMPLKML